MKIESENHDLVVQSLTGAFRTTQMEQYTSVEFEPHLDDTIVVNIVAAYPKRYEEVSTEHQEETLDKSQE